uniref:ZP domain-containing protein n=1 Tax=Hucho hucho TaxID=62062 RepID=A0A4W5NRS7_9TELE
MCGTCGVGETCVSTDGVTWRCERPDQPVSLRPEVVCGRSLVQVGLNRTNLEAAGLDATTANLADPRCNAHKERGGMVWYQVERKEGACGNTLETNGTDAIFSNSLFIYHIPDVSFTRPVSVPFSCAYPLESETSLDVVIKPYLSLKDSKVGKGSKVGSNMTLYHSDNFTKAYPVGGVTLPVGSVLHVGVSVEESETERFVVVLEDCYATQSPDPEDIMRHYVIQNKCPTEFRQVRVEENGSSLRARFSALLFLYQGDYQDVFLHCRLSLCDKRSSSCTPVSPASFLLTHPLSLWSFSGLTQFVVLLWSHSVCCLALVSLSLWSQSVVSLWSHSVYGLSLVSLSLWSLSSLTHFVCSLSDS